MLGVDGVNSVDLSQSGIKSIPANTFKNQNDLVSITVLNGTIIDMRAFAFCRSLETVNGMIDYVEMTAFQACDALTGVWINGSVGYKSFGNCSSLQYLRVGKNFTITDVEAFPSGIRLIVYYDDPEDTEFEKGIESQLNSNGVSVDHFVPGCTEDEWNDILESNKPTIEANPTPDNALARLILGL